MEIQLESKLSCLMKRGDKGAASQTSGRFAQAAGARTCFALALVHAAGVNCWISVILAPGRRMNKSFR